MNFNFELPIITLALFLTLLTFILSEMIVNEEFLKDLVTTQRSIIYFQGNRELDSSGPVNYKYIQSVWEEFAAEEYYKFVLLKATSHPDFDERYFIGKYESSLLIFEYGVLVYFSRFDNDYYSKGFFVPTGLRLLRPQIDKFNSIAKSLDHMRQNPVRNRLVLLCPLPNGRFLPTADYGNFSTVLGFLRSINCPNYVPFIEVATLYQMNLLPGCLDKGALGFSIVFYNPTEGLSSGLTPELQKFTLFSIDQNGDYVPLKFTDDLEDLFFELNRSKTVRLAQKLYTLIESNDFHGAMNTYGSLNMLYLLKWGTLIYDNKGFIPLPEDIKDLRDLVPYLPILYSRKEDYIHSFNPRIPIRRGSYYVKLDSGSGEIIVTEIQNLNVFYKNLQNKDFSQVQTFFAPSSCYLLANLRLPLCDQNTWLFSFILIPLYFVSPVPHSWLLLALFGIIFVFY